MISSPNGVETTLGCSAADRAVADSPAAAVKRETVRNKACSQPSSEPADKVQCLGDMPWRCRATAGSPTAFIWALSPEKSIAPMVPKAASAVFKKDRRG